ncbi:protein WHAT'S THIS FACTOR 1 homolog, chloroplastic-like [Spinacia oleracea]|uniref:Protein WHAT'S THIS FACTOR 1 homolog, chloroplastic-like n=1 Tax=Spinacia oleracea TaxID=3562 RepID=A0A9R0JIK4_SPIOL|nr:protein WHAT'S THIS FACTOR 1 homolog, chloroplastic-like [Spinacia oleracea]
MAWKHLFTAIAKHSLKPYSLSKTKPPIFSLLQTSPFSTSFLITKTPKKFKKKRQKPSPRNTSVQHPSSFNTHFENLVNRDNSLRFLTRSKLFLAKQPEHILRLDDAGKLYRELGFPRGRKVNKFVAKHPLIFEIYRHDNNKMWLGFTEFMENLLQEEVKIMESMELERVKVVKKLLMMSKDKRMALSKIYHCRSLFGVPENFRDWVLKFSDDFRVVNGEDGSRILELVRWDPALAISALEKEFMVDEEKVKRAFKFPVKHGKELDLEEDDVRRLNLLNTLPLVSPYSDGWKHELSSLEGEKYRVGIIHEFLSLTLEKKGSIHHIVEFKEEFSLTKHTYQMLKKQSRAFYLAGTEMNWVVFLNDGYDEDGNLIQKDPQVDFNERLYKFAQMQHPDELCCDSMNE